MELEGGSASQAVLLMTGEGLRKERGDVPGSLRKMCLPLFHFLPPHAACSPPPASRSRLFPSLTLQVPLATALMLAQYVLRRKIMMSQRDWVGVMLFGAEKAADEDLEDGEDGHADVLGGASQLFGGQTIELQTMGEPTAKRIKQLEQLCADESDLAQALRLKWTDGSSSYSSSSSAALRDGIRACMRMLETRSKKERDMRRIWLITNEDDPSGANDPSQVIKDAQEAGVDVRLWHFAPADGRTFDEQKFYGPLLSAAKQHPEPDYAKADEDETESDTKMVDAGAGDMDTLLGATQGRLFKKRRYARTTWHVSESPPLSLNVALYKTIHPCKKPAPVQLAAATNRRLVTSTKWMCEELVQYVDIELEAAHGLEFGSSRTTVPFERPEYEAVRRAGQSEPGLHLLGFVPAVELAWELNVSSSTLVYPEELSLKGCTRAFISLREAMLTRERMAVVRYQATAKSESRLAVLLASSHTAGLELIKLPFLDDLRVVESPHLDTPPPPPDKTQLEAAKVVLTRMNMKESQYTDQGFNNPALEKFYSGLQALALEETEADWDEVRDDMTWPDEENLLSRAGKALQDLWDACPDPVKGARGGGGAGGAKRKAAAAVEKKVKSSPPAKKSKGKKKVKVEEEDEDEDEDDEEGGGAGHDLESLIATGKLSKLTVSDLKELCRVRGLPVSGKKGDLIDRLKMDVEEVDF